MPSSSVGAGRSRPRVIIYLGLPQVHILKDLVPDSQGRRAPRMVSSFRDCTMVSAPMEERGANAIRLFYSFDRDRDVSHGHTVCRAGSRAWPAG